MLRPTAIKVIPLDDYLISVVFDNNETKTMDIKPYIKWDWYIKLKDPDYFKTVHVNGYTVEWQDGQDICPDELYYCSKS